MISPIAYYELIGLARFSAERHLTSDTCNWGDRWDDSRRGRAAEAVGQVHRDAAQRMVILDDRTVDPRQQQDAPE